MSSRKFSFSILLAVLLLAVVAFFFASYDTGDRGPASPDEGMGTRVEPLGSLAAREGEPQVEAPDSATSESGAGEETSLEAVAVDDRPISLEGKVSNAEGEGVPGARVVALDTGAWGEILADAEQRFEDPVTALRALRREYRMLSRKVASTETDEEGGYVFRALAEGDYRIMVSHGDYLPRQDVWVVISEGRKARADLELVEGHAITGRVVDEEGKGLGGVSVSSRPYDQSRARGVGKLMQALTSLADGDMLLQASEVTTSDDGSFRLGSLEPVLHSVRAHKEGYAPSEMPKAPPGTRDVVLVLSRGASVAGRTLDSRQRPIAGAAIEIGQPKIDPNRMNPMLLAAADVDFLGEKTRSGESGEEGEFRLDGLQEGFYELNVRADGSPPYTEKLRIGKGVTQVGDIVLEEPMMISGVVRNEQGLPIEGARVRAFAAEKGGRDRVVPRAARSAAEDDSDARGMFALEGLAKGDYRVQAVADAFGEAMVEEVEAGKRDLTITLGEGLTLEGLVLDREDRSPVAGARVRLVGLSRNSRRVTTGDDGRFALRGIPQDVPSRFGGNVHLQVSHPDYERVFTRAKLGEKEPLEVLLAASKGLQGVVVDAEGDPVARARVSIEIPGLPSGLMALASGGQVPVYTSEDGTFFLSVPRQMDGPGNSIDIVASHPSHGRSRLGPLKRPTGDEPWPEVDLVLSEGSAIEGRVVDAAGAPVDGARLRAERVVKLDPQMIMFSQMMGGSTGEVTYATKDGAFKLRGLDAGTYKVEVAALGYARKTITPVEVGDEPAKLEIVLDPGASISGHVVDSEGTPLPGVEVVALPELEVGDDEDARRMARLSKELQVAGAVGIASARTDEEGAYQMTHLPESEFTVVARAPGYLPADAENVRGGDEVPDLVLSALARLVGRAIDGRTRAPIGRFQARLSRRDPEGDDSFDRFLMGSSRERSFEDPAGRFVYDDLPAGRFRVKVWTEEHAPSSKDIVLEPGDELSVEVALQSGSRVEGVVRASGTEDPLQGVRVRLRAARRGGESPESWRDVERRTAVTDADGAYSFGGVGDGEFRITVEHPFYYWDGEADDLSVAVEDMEPVALDITMHPAGRVKGRIRNLVVDRDQGYHNVLLTRIDEKESEGARGAETGRAEGDAEKPRRSRSIRRSAWVNPNGEYTADGLAPGRYRVELQPYRFRTTSVPGQGGEMKTSRVVDEEPPRLLGEVEVRAGETQTLDAEGR